MRGITTSSIRFRVHSAWSGYFTVWHRAAGQPPLTPHMFELGLLAILFHDTGYLKRRGDNEGTAPSTRWSTSTAVRPLPGSSWRARLSRATWWPLRT